MNFKLFLLAIFLFAFAIFVSAQSIVLNMDPKPSPYISDWQNKAGTITLSISNVLSTSIELKSKAELFDGNGSLIANTEAHKMPVLNIPPGVSIFNAEDVFPLSALTYKGNLESKVRETGRIPEDNYRICVYIIDPITGVEIGQSKNTCKLFTIISYKPPVLIAPANNEVIAGPVVSGITFRWTPVIPSTSFIVNYRLHVWEVLDGQNSVTALRNNQPIVEKDIRGMTQTIWPVEFAGPEDGKNYVWTITPLDNDERKFIDDPGFAEPFGFKVESGLRSSTQPACESISTQKFVSGSTISLSDGFELILTKDPTGGNDSLVGKGKVRVNWLGILNVQFQGIKINDENKLCYGTIYTVSDSAQDYPNQWAGIALGSMIGSTNIGTWTSGMINDVNSHIKNKKLSQALVDADNTVVSLTSTPLTMPIGYFQNGDTINSIGFTEMRFDGVHAEFDVIASLETKGIFNEKSVLDGTDAISLLGTGIEFTKNGLKDINGEIKLLEPLVITYTKGLKLTLNKEGTGHIGNSIVFKNNSNEFWKYKLDASIELPKDWLIPKDPNKTNVELSFQMEIVNWDDFILQASLPACIIPNTNGTGLEVGNIIYDHSLISNFPNIEFPAGYNGETSELFSGLYLKDFKFTLPDQLRTYEDTSKLIEILSKDLIINEDGITGNIYAFNVINYPKANVGNLGASIDTVSVKIRNSTLTEAKVIGLITLPMSESSNSTNAINYIALFTPTGSSSINSSTITFTLKPKNDINCKFFGDGKLQINQTSSLNLVMSKTTNNSRTINLNFILNGKLYYPTGKILDPGSSSPLDLDLSCNFESLGMTYIKDTEEKFTFNVGHWSFASPQKKLSGFSFTITDVVPKIEEIVQTTEAQYLFKGGVEFVAIINIGTDKVNIGGDVKILISGGVISSKYGTINVNSLGEVKQDYQFLTHLKAAFIGVRVLDVHVEVKVAAADILGKVSFKKNDIIYGNAFMGDITVKFTTINLGVQAGAIFGNTKYKPGNTGPGFKYWMVQAQVNLPPPGIVFMTGLAFRGFGAGVYSRMQMTPPAVFNPSTAASSTFGGAIFTPDETVSVGFKVKAIIATTPKEETFNGSVALGAEFNTSGGINKIEFDGLFNCGSQIGKESDAFASGNISVTYVFPTKIFDLTTQLLLDTRSKGIDIYTPSAITTKLYIDGKNNKWFFKSGTPTNPMAVNAFNVATNSYLMFGNDLGSDIPNGFMALTNSGWAQAGLAPMAFVDNATQQGKYKNAKGFAFGVAVKGGQSDSRSIFNYNGNCCDGGCALPKNWHDVTRYLNINFSYVAGGEVDASLLQYNGCTGFNKGWRASVAVAIYAGTTVGWDGNLPLTDCATESGTLAGARAGATALAEFPNPTYFNGRVSGTWSISKWSGSFDKNIEIGTQCQGTEQQLDPSINENNIHQQQNVKDSLNKKLITKIISPGSSTDVSRKTNFSSLLEYPYNESFDIEEQQSTGQLKVRTFKVTYTATLTQDSIPNSNGTVESSSIGGEGFDNTSSGKGSISKTKDKPSTSTINISTSTPNQSTINASLNIPLELVDAGYDELGAKRFNLKSSGGLLVQSGLKANTSYKFQMVGILQEKNSTGAWQNANIGTSANPIKDTKVIYFKTNNDDLVDKEQSKDKIDTKPSLNK